jgi:hypothetical protein
MVAEVKTREEGRGSYGPRVRWLKIKGTTIKCRRIAATPVRGARRVPTAGFLRHAVPALPVALELARRLPHSVIVSLLPQGIEKRV